MSTHNQVLDQLYAKYDGVIASGERVPFVYPWGAFGALLVLLYLLVPHHNSPFLRLLRYPVWALNAYISLYTIMHCRARNSAPAFGVGLISSWSILWTATIMIVHDAQNDFQRIERTEGAVSSSLKKMQNGGPKQMRGLRPVTTIKDIDYAAEQKRLGTKAGPTHRKGKFAWQHYPLHPFAERLDWVADVFCNFRGMGWNWRISGLAPPPEWVQKELAEESGAQISDKDTHLGADGTHRYHTRRECLRAALKSFVVGYLTLDLLKVIVTLDPYFWGHIDSPAPTWLPAIVRSSPVLTTIWRLSISLAAVKTALVTIFSMGPLFFVGLLGTDWIGARGEPWMYPDTYGSFRMVLDKGLAGWWGGWWHQTFRFAFAAPSKRIIATLGMNPKSMPARTLQLIIAFTLSGCLHASGSYTMVGHTNPLTGPFSFFFSQAFGIMLQTFLTGILTKTGIFQKTPKLIRQIVNFFYVHVWFYYTGPLLCDDFARGGLWLFEPVPVSPLRALGFGDADSKWWCWGMREGADWFRWHTGEHWWHSGLAT
ncbi:uncharacterized protein K452DRAFT_286569 [Aplosporella prunicola CBS 121167]|uniref:Wax synthase domain-containing protein n=1 Tax=Aplosporella prunicola CBS 121167 TaxID=1176127 RepID=A0A6A6BH66_9PEZI|nr:uncharacterized protein K452DRAFT_286569 [Aplosporella prunicola CBS 121167]KAF2142938.1 hypothetical protein K452DRAFT_286569 [Aplosporella prunicola CBS 121167]